MDLQVGKRAGNGEGNGGIRDSGGNGMAGGRKLDRKVEETGRNWSWIKSGGLYLVSTLYFFSVYVSLHLPVLFPVLLLFSRVLSL
jgi:hypothetical protein